jgi:hypothetical protein
MISRRRLTHLAFSGLNAVVEPIARSPLSGPLPVGTGLMLMESTGRRSGGRRSQPVLALRFGRTVYSATLRSSSDWVANLRATPEVELWLDGGRTAATAALRPLPRGTLATLQLDPAGAASR